MKNTLFNPFLRIAGTKALLIGLTLLLCSSVIAYYSRCHFDGAIDAHIGAITPMWFYPTESLIDWAILLLSFYTAGLICSTSNIRFIDIAGTIALARWPMIFVALLAFAPIPQPQDIHNISPSIIVLGFGILIFTIWMITLMYNAYSISCNIKGNKAIVSFIAAIVFAEIISKLIIIQIARHIHLNA
jgi:hypothetical protein